MNRRDMLKAALAGGVATWLDPRKALGGPVVVMVAPHPHSWWMNRVRAVTWEWVTVPSGGSLTPATLRAALRE